MVNQKIDNSRDEELEIKVGTPATFISYSDRSPGVVVAIHSKSCIEIAPVTAKARKNPNSSDGSWEYGAYVDYDYFPDLTRKGELYTKRKNGTYQLKGCAYDKGNGYGRVILGYMKKYMDPSF